MKKSNIIILSILAISLMLLYGCGEDAPVDGDAPGEMIEPADEAAAQPDLPDDAQSDVEDGDITQDMVDVAEEVVQDVEEIDEEITEDFTNPAGDENGSSESENVTSDDGSEKEGLTAQNYQVISLKDLKAYPGELHITVGTTVEWRNVNDNLNHLIGWSHQKQMGVTPEPIGPGESWSYMFEEPGQIKWFSTPRPTIGGVIYVEE